MPTAHPLDALDVIISSSSDLVYSSSSSTSSYPRSPSSSSRPSLSTRFFSTFTASDSPSLSMSQPIPSISSSASAPSSPSLAPASPATRFSAVLSLYSPSQASSGCWSGPPLARHRLRLLMYTSKPMLLLVFAVQLLLHTAYLAASILLLARPSLLTDLLQGEERPFAFPCLQYLPVFLIARSAVSIPLLARRIRLMKRWQSTWVDSAVCATTLALTCVLAMLSLLALASLPSSLSVMYSLAWVLVGSLLLLAGWQLVLYAVLLLFFRMDNLTLCTPMLPLNTLDYVDAEESKPQRNEGLTPDQLQALPLSAYEGGRDDACCAVCMDDVAVGDMQRELRCGHCYHQACIDRWLLKKRSCPLCVRAVRVSSRSSSEWTVEMVDRAKPDEEDEEDEEAPEISTSGE